jgi:hypothetical protein
MYPPYPITSLEDEFSTRERASVQKKRLTDLGRYPAAQAYQNYRKLKTFK